MKMVIAHVGSSALVRLAGRLDDLLGMFDEVRSAEPLDESTAAMLARSYL